jgi:hypothetical protein
MIPLHASCSQITGSIESDSPSVDQWIILLASSDVFSGDGKAFDSAAVSISSSMARILPAISASGAVAWTYSCRSGSPSEAAAS